ncbi:MAG: methyltransferase domain-containing protein [Caulobacter sp.]|nr:methyltransferase domain-containing protein [Caulobacter sp.]
MHDSSYRKMGSFLQTYRDRFPTHDGRARVLEIGSKSYQGQDTHRGLIDDARETYTGLDLESGKNVDIVPANMYVWDEIPDSSVDVCISGSTFEHNPFFWVTACEIARVLTPGGFVCIIAPGGGPVHRYPVDCYRFYPDSWGAMAALAGLEIEEVYFETDETALQVPGGLWRDSMMIARKPVEDAAQAAIAQERRTQVTQPFRGGFGKFEAVGHRYGPAVEAYRSSVTTDAKREIRLKIGRRIAPYNVLRIYVG